ncbi:MAG: hypothetical protein CL908_23215 [Deltaproteobacteria bacterium]|nr:hypothetical protein [Deltaproteobacteria bacterium]
MPEFSRDELERMTELFEQGIERAETTGDWIKHVGCLYTDDALYEWNLGPNIEFRARGRKEIEAYAMGSQMEGLKDWRYPYTDWVIDDKRGEVIGFFRQIAPAKRDDGTHYELEGLCGSWFFYGGNYQWREQRDFFDVGNLKALMFELAGIGALSPELKRDIHLSARGHKIPGNHRIRRRPSLLERLRGIFAILKIALTGK